jgi:hypothetical protein
VSIILVHSQYFYIRRCSYILHFFSECVISAVTEEFSLIPAGALPRMNLMRHIAVLSFFLTVGATSGWAQTTSFVSGNSVSLDGLTAKITALSCSACTSGDVLEVFEFSKNNLVFEVVNPTASSSIFSSTGSTETLSFTLAISPTAGYTHASGKASSVTQTAVGWEQYTNCTTCSNSSAIASTTFSPAVTTNPLLSTLGIQNKNTAPSQQTLVGIADNIATATNTFTISSSLTLTPGVGVTVGRLEFDSLALRLHTVPEPASASVLLFSLGGLLIARRRRRIG